MRSTPAFVPFVAVPLLGEHVTPGGVLGVALVVASLWAVTWERGRGVRVLRSPGAMLALLTLGTTVGYSLVDAEAMRRLGEVPWSGRVPPAVAFMTLLYVFYLPGFVLMARRRVGPREVGAILRARAPAVVTASLFGFASYTLVLHAMQTAPVSYITAVRQSSVLFALAIAVVFLRERPGRLRLVGAVANVAGVALIAVSG